MTQTTTTVTVRGDRLARNAVLFWIALEILLVTLDTVVNYNRLTEISQLRKMCNIAREDGVATWFSSMQLLLVSGVIAVIAWRVRIEGNSKWRFRAWALICSFFAYLSFDDGAKVHERLATAVKKMLAAGGDTSEVASFFPSYMWQVIFLPVFGAMGIFMVVFFWREVRSNKSRFTFAAALGRWVVAVGLDFIEGLDQGYEDVAEMLGVSIKFAEHYGRVVEEFLEMFGTTLFLGGFLGHLSRIWGWLEVRVSRAA